MRKRGLYTKLDWPLVICYLLLVLFGWINIFSVLHGDGSNIFDISEKYGKHFLWICVSVTTAFIIIRAIPPGLWNSLAWVLYVLEAVLLLAVPVLGKEINGSRSWLALGPLTFQPAEFSKICTALALSSIFGRYGFNLKSFSSYLKPLITMAIPMMLILLEKETGSVLVYMGFLVMLYREGMSGWYLVVGFLIILEFILTILTSPFVAIVVAVGIFLMIYFAQDGRYLMGILATAIAVALLAFFPKLLAIPAIAAINPFRPEIWLAIILVAVAFFFLVRIILRHPRMVFLRNALIALIAGILFVLSVQVIYNNVLGDHQRNRIEVFLGLVEDPKGVGYNVHQSMVAIGSGGLHGKGFLNGTQTSLGYVPEQETDFIFCTIGEEWGFLGGLFILSLYLVIIGRLITLAEKSKDKFTRVYGYCVAMCFAVHVIINIGMTIGLMPIIGIPLPLVSYGGSSLLAFTTMLAIFLRLDLERKKI